MIIIKDKFTSPAFNLALEEYLFKTVQQNCFMLWQNDKSIIVGKNQNTLSEINHDYVTKNNIPVIRRITGGGAVYHDLGNINYTFVEINGAENFLNYGRYTWPILSALRQLGVNAELSGRNDIEIDGKKISGNAQHAYKGRIMHHGTLLYDTQTDVLADALMANELKVQSKGVKSVKSRVTNISSHMEKKIPVKEFIDFLIHVIKEETGESCVQYELQTSDISAANELLANKYSTWMWNYGNSPPYTHRKEAYIHSGYLDVRLDVKDGFIKDCKVYGDFFGTKDIGSVECTLLGVRHNLESMRQALMGIDISSSISGICLDEFLALLI